MPCATTANSKICAKRATKPCFFLPPAPPRRTYAYPRIDIMRISPIASADQSAKNELPHEKTDTWLHRPSLRREESPCQLGAELQADLEKIDICELLLVKLFHDSQTGHAEFTFPKSFRNSKHRNERNETACARWRLEENPKATIALGRAFFANEHGTGRKVFISTI